MNGKAIKKPIEIDFCKNPTDINKLNDWVTSFGDDFTKHFDVVDDGVLEKGIKVNTFEGSSYYIKGTDVILRGTKGEYWPVDGEIFNETYNIQ